MQMQMQDATILGFRVRDALGVLCTKVLDRDQRLESYLQALLRMSNPVAVMLILITIVVILHICEANAVVPKGELEQLPTALGCRYCPGLWHKLDAAGMANWSQELLTLACHSWHTHTSETL